MIEGTPHSAPTLVEHVRVDHRRADIAVAQQFLDRPDVMARFEQVRRERVAQGVARCRAWDPRSTDGVLHGEAVLRDSAKAEVSRIFEDPTRQNFAKSEDPTKESATSH